MSTNDYNARLSGIGTLLMAITSVYSVISLIASFFQSTLTFVPVDFLFPLLGIVGFILFMVGMKGLSVRYQTPAIFNNTLYAVLSAIVGGVAIGIISFITVIVNLSSIVRSITPYTADINIFDAVGVFGSIFIPVIIAGLVVGLIVALFYFHAFNRLAEKSGIKRFRTVSILYLVSVIFTGVLMLIGAVLVAANNITFSFMLMLPTPVNIITCATFILATVGFFSIKTPAQRAHIPASSTAPRVKYCSYCGASNQNEAVYCANCGKPMQSQ